jgi:HEAT repeat protein
LAVLLAAVGGIILWRVEQRRDPVYRGEPLSQWLEEYDPRILIENKEEVDDAIRHIGTNAIPTLLEMLRSKDNAAIAALIKRAERADLIWLSLAEETDVEAARGFEVLGASAKDAVPDLIEIYEERISPDSQMATAYALGCIGPAAKNAIPQLLEAATNANKGLRPCAIRSLGQIHSEPELSVPAVMRALDDTDQQTRYEAAKALGAFGTNATAAIPALVRAFKSRDKHIYRTAADALKAIDAEAAVKAGVK